MQARFQFAAVRRRGLSGWLALFSIASMVLSGCGGSGQDQGYQRPPLQINRLLWSKSGWIAVDSNRPSLAILEADGRLKKTLPIAGAERWDPTGRYLLYGQDVFDPDSYDYQEQVGLYDGLENSARLTPQEGRVVNRGFWYRSGDIGLIGPVSSTGPSQYEVRIFDTAGKVKTRFPAPAGLIPWVVVYDDRHDRLFCSAYAFRREGINHFFYFVQDKHFTPITAAEGYGFEYAYSPQRDVAAIAALDDENMLHRIDLLDLNQTSPTPRTLIPADHLPKRCYFDSMALSDDGSHLAIAVSNEGGESSVYVYDLATGRSMDIGQGGLPAFSPNGREIAFVDAGDRPFTRGTRVFVCRLDGSQMREIYNEATFGEMLAMWLGKWFLAIAVVIAGWIVAGVYARRRKRRTVVSGA